MIIEDVIQNLKTSLEGLTWQPSGNTMPTSFIGGVYTAMVLNGVEGSPWCCIEEVDAPTIKQASRGRNGDTVYTQSLNIGINICTNRSNLVTNQEHLARLRYVTTQVEQFIKGAGNLYDDGFVQGWNYTGWSTLDAGELNVNIRRLIITNFYTI